MHLFAMRNMYWPGNVYCGVQHPLNAMQVVEVSARYDNLPQCSKNSSTNEERERVVMQVDCRCLCSSTTFSN